MGICPWVGRQYPGFYAGESYLNLLVDTANFCSKTLTAYMLCAIYWVASKYLRQIDSSHVSGIPSPVRRFALIQAHAYQGTMSNSGRYEVNRLLSYQVSILTSKLDRSGQMVDTDVDRC